MKNLLLILPSVLFAVCCANAQDTLHIKELGTYVKVKEEVPIPPTINIDNVDKAIIYTGTWYNGPTDAPGFEGNTMAYSTIAGNTATLTFTGTMIEVFCEKKVGQGSAAFQVDSQPPVTVPLGVAGPVGSTSVFKVELPSGNHTFKLTIAGGGYVVFDYVKINGSVVAPLPPDPPPTDVINVVPGQSIKAAVESATAGKTVTIQTGNYSESNITVPIGVEITGVGTVTITATTYGALGSAEVGLFMFKSNSPTDGNQTISNLILEGNNIGYGGILVDKRNKIFIRNCIIQNFNFHGIWLRSVRDSEVTDNELNNTAWASTGYSSGQINIFDLTNVSILRNRILSNKDKKGTGIEALWKLSTMTNVKIMNNYFDLSHLNPWNNYQAKNFSIEIHDTYYNGIEIAYNEFKNQLSMASHFPATAATPGKTWIHHNTGNLGGDTMFVENICDNLDVSYNTITGCSMFAANFRANSIWKNNSFHHNNFTSSGAVSWGGVFLIGKLGVQNYTITDNVMNVSQWPSNKRVVYMGVTGGVTETNNTWR